MEIKINREIRHYSESMFFGLTLRQLVFTAAGIACAVILYFSFQNRCGTELLSWICMSGAAPFVTMGFLRYNGMSAEELAVVWFRSKIAEPKKVKFECDTLYRNNGKGKEGCIL